VINTEGQVVGLVLGETTGSPVKLIGHEDLADVLASYITPMTLIQESIKKWLGRNMLVTSLIWKN
jgi:hypothetical protein